MLATNPDGVIQNFITVLTAPSQIYAGRMFHKLQCILIMDTSKH